MHKYETIRRWGQHLASFPYYIQGEIERAQAEGAPETAIYKTSCGAWPVGPGRWVTAEEIADPVLRAHILGT